MNEPASSSFPPHLEHRSNSTPFTARASRDEKLREINFFSRGKANNFKFYSPITQAAELPSLRARADLLRRNNPIVNAAHYARLVIHGDNLRRLFLA